MTVMGIHTDQSNGVFYTMQNHSSPYVSVHIVAQFENFIEV